MRMPVALHVFGRFGLVLLVALIAFAIGAAPAAQQPPPSGRGGAETQGGQRGRQGGRGQQPDTGAVRDDRGAVIGHTGLAELPGTPWRIHDAARPQPRKVEPGQTSGAPPADAIVLFDGTDFSKFVHMRQGQPVPAEWVVRDGYVEVVPRTGSVVTRDRFGDIQLHLEFMAPDPANGASQDRGNSGVILMGRYEVQVLDSYDNVTYADGHAASIYGEYPPLVNAARKPGEWQTYDVVFEAPKFDGERLVSPAYLTVFWNGLIVHNRRPVMGSTSATRTPHGYTAHDPELPFTLQDHSHPVRYRNIWVRKLTGYDQP